MRQDVSDFLISIYVYFGMSGLFLLSQLYTVLFMYIHVCQVRRGCLLKTERTLLRNLRLGYKFYSKL